ncbi:hypothetical protein B1H18_32140 [Streptomyces tsukubensis]|uniref:Uncharacterized protein n=1 Tax=Streptomyces tsukubensis TaxID=83656 RepID=A0A1V4A0H9_9ACTN|nr:hypothetical protein B1H18_32140 [Streptomyces tsukubensis]
MERAVLYGWSEKQKVPPANRSGASLIALASRWRITAVPVAVRLGSEVLSGFAPQQHPVAAQPAHRMIEQGLGPLACAVHPRPSRNDRDRVDLLRPLDHLSLRRRTAGRESGRVRPRCGRLRNQPRKQTSP